MRSSLSDLFSDVSGIPKDPQGTIDFLGRFAILRLAYNEEIGANPGYIFRGEADWPCPLQSSVERYFVSNSRTWCNAPEAFKTFEMEKFNKLVNNAGQWCSVLHPEHKSSQAPIDHEVIWWLALMQHYGGCTRLLDFTREILLALYFAIEQREKDSGQTLTSNVHIYCFPCLNLDPTNAITHKESNKSPFEEHVDINLAMGKAIGLEWASNFSTKIKTGLNAQSWGWDQPYYQNHRLQGQRGMFVYPFDNPNDPVKASESDSWLVYNLKKRSCNPFNLREATAAIGPTSAKRIIIDGSLVNDLKRILKTNFNLHAQTVYERCAGNKF